jgi:hypothetical protein
MVPLTELWLPILLSAVLVFAASSVIHMALQYHKKDYVKLPGEEQLLAAMRAQNLAPGHYIFPCAGSLKEMGTPEMLAKLQQGPVGSMIVRPSGPISMGTSLVQWFLLSLAISVLVAYAAGLGLAPGTEPMLVFRLASAVALLGYAVTYVTDSIWKGLSWGVTAKFLLDGLVYALCTGGAFAWLWPSAAA